MILLLRNIGYTQLIKEKFIDSYNQKEINRRRTFAIISHPDAGKTTLTDIIDEVAERFSTVGAQPFKSFSSKEKQIWVIREKKIKAKGNNRKRPSLIQRKNEN